MEGQTARPPYHNPKHITALGLVSLHDPLFYSCTAFYHTERLHSDSLPLKLSNCCCICPLELSRERQIAVIWARLSHLKGKLMMVQVPTLITGYIHLGVVNSWQLYKKFILLRIYRCRAWQENCLYASLAGPSLKSIHTLLTLLFSAFSLFSLINRLRQLSISVIDLCTGIYTQVCAYSTSSKAWENGSFAGSFSGTGVLH